MKNYDIDAHTELWETLAWLEKLVIDLNLCPFAKRELLKNRVRFSLCTEEKQELLLGQLEEELDNLSEHPEIETTLLVHPNAFADFYDFNDFLGRADALLRIMDLEGVFQIASFHPQYQFSGTDVDDAENFTNRSPYPCLHLIREESLEHAVDSHPDPEGIPTRNIELMNSMGVEKIQALLASCRRPNG
ncbi:MAG: hypothetical protein ACI93R_002213 [Flavobacteriales bacterium]